MHRSPRPALLATRAKRASSLAVEMGALAGEVAAGVAAAGAAKAVATLAVFGAAEVIAEAAAVAGAVSVVVAGAAAVVVEMGLVVVEAAVGAPLEGAAVALVAHVDATVTLVVRATAAAV